MRTLLGGLSVFSMVIVFAALKRLAAYEHAYGFTRARVVVGGFELWLGLVFALILVVGIRLRACSLQLIAVRLAASPDDWRSWNFSRVDARDQIGTFDLDTARGCPAKVRRH